jgi:NADPH:quinone reductase
LNQYNNYICKKVGSIQNLVISKARRESLKKNYVRIKVYAIGLNYIDYLMIKGDYQYKNNIPFIPGTEACGIVIEENSNNKKLLNKRVIINTKSGCFSEEVVVDVKNIYLFKNNLNSLKAATFFISALTSYISLIEIANIKKNQTLIISGASGGIGQASIELAKYKGANVISIVSNNKKKLISKKIGANISIKNDEDIYNSVMNYTKNKKVDIILDLNGFLKNYNILRCLKWRGKYLIAGFTDNNITTLKTNYILIKGLQVFGVRAGEYLNRINCKKKNSILKEVFKLSYKNICTTKEYKTLSFKNLKKGLELIKERKSFGKIIIKTKYYKEY